ncbi:hypothetical protein FB451DRAFT_1177941 [Mycena latifolia]|nr:hypothetical protein FB451DRAFT_1177941 [Mycena latifolia]
MNTEVTLGFDWVTCIWECLIYTASVPQPEFFGLWLFFQLIHSSLHVRSLLALSMSSFCSVISHSFTPMRLAGPASPFVFNVLAILQSLIAMSGCHPLHIAKSERRITFNTLCHEERTKVGDEWHAFGRILDQLLLPSICPIQNRMCKAAQSRMRFLCIVQSRVINQRIYEWILGHSDEI